MNFDNNSHICAIKGTSQSFIYVNEKIQGAKLPVVCSYQNDHMHYYFQYKSLAVCDFNTATCLEQVIENLYKLYQLGV